MSGRMLYWFDNHETNSRQTGCQKETDKAAKIDLMCFSFKST